MFAVGDLRIRADTERIGDLAPQKNEFRIEFLLPCGFFGPIEGGDRRARRDKFFGILAVPLAVTGDQPFRGVCLSFVRDGEIRLGKKAVFHLFLRFAYHGVDCLVGIFSAVAIGGEIFGKALLGEFIDVRGIGGGDTERLGRLNQARARLGKARVFREQRLVGIARLQLPCDIGTHRHHLGKGGGERTDLRGLLVGGRLVRDQKRRRLLQRKKKGVGIRRTIGNGRKSDRTAVVIHLERRNVNLGIVRIGRSPRRRRGIFVRSVFFCRCTGHREEDYGGKQGKHEK